MRDPHRRSVLLTCWPPAPLARYVSIRRSPSSISTVDVVGDQRRDDHLRERRVPAVRRVERREPDEAVLAALGLQVPVRVLASTVNVADLIPASSPGLTSSTSVLKPRSSAQRRYMRRRISAQSCASVPPAPAWIVTTASPASYSPEKSASSCSRSSSARAERSTGDLVGDVAVHREQLLRVLVLAVQPLVALEPLPARACSAETAPRAAGRPRIPARRAAPARRRASQAIGVKGNHGPRRAGPRSPRAARRARLGRAILAMVACSTPRDMYRRQIGHVAVVKGEVPAEGVLSPRVLAARPGQGLQLGAGQV